MSGLYLIRHGQARFGDLDYDVLSGLGRQQAALAGQWLASRRALPELAYSGSLRRQQDSAALALEAAGKPAPLRLDAGLDEFDYLAVLARHRSDLDSPAAIRAWLAGQTEPHRAFQREFAAAMERWTTGWCDDDYAESWPAFKVRVVAVLRRLRDEAGRQGATTLWVFTSGGVIAALCQSVLDMSDRATMALNWRLANAGITRLSLGGGEPALACLNQTAHLDHDPALVSYR